MNADFPQRALSFQHEAMNTTFSLRFPGGIPSAEAMARDCFELLDRLEGKLSRFLDDSEISRVNGLQAGERLYLSEETHACLRLAVEMHAATGGLFDVSLGRAIRHRKDEETAALPALAGQLWIHPDQAAVTCVEPGRELDLGGIGKGFALDQMAALLEEWEASSCLLSAGASTHLAYGEIAWPIELEGAVESHGISLQRAALSASGTGIQGSHIVHPDPEAALAQGRHWVVAETAAISDAWSTAMILASPEEAAELLGAWKGKLQHYEEIDGRPTIRFFSSLNP